MNEIVIVGAGAFGREVVWLIERINKVNNQWKIKGFIDDNIAIGTKVENYSVIGKVSDLKSVSKSLNVVCAIGNAMVRKKIGEEIGENDYLIFPNLMDPDTVVSPDIRIGRGNIICAGCVLSINVKMNDFNVIDWNCTVGHDVILKDYITLYPATNLSGYVQLDGCSELGVGTKIIQGIRVCQRTILGAGSVVINNLTEPGVYVGVPVKNIK